jgi:hypothetical protein
MRLLGSRPTGTRSSTSTSGVIDLAALRFTSEFFPDQALPAAGLPWFMTVFGRDSLITSYQALPFTPELAETTLRVLARYQGTKVDPFRDELPGRILYEIRFGELTHFEERPHSPYGAADTTPLFLILLDEVERWTGNAELVRDLEPAARAALAFLDEHGDLDGDGYVAYERAQETGLENQCWKDSWDSMRFADGTIAKGPIAACEIQGYVYDAKVRSARLARELWNDPELAASLERQAAELKERFNRDYWLEDRGHYALALDGGHPPRHARDLDGEPHRLGARLRSTLFWDGEALSRQLGATGRRLRADPRCFGGEPVADAWAHVCALPIDDAKLPFDFPEVQQVRRDALAWWVPPLGDALVCLTTLAVDSVHYGGAITVATDPAAFDQDPFARVLPGTTVRTSLFSRVPPPVGPVVERYAGVAWPGGALSR